MSSEFATSSRAADSSHASSTRSTPRAGDAHRGSEVERGTDVDSTGPVATDPVARGDIDSIPHLRRIENLSVDAMIALATMNTHATYRHEYVYGKYCTLQEHIDCPPGDVYRYLADVLTLEEWTYSLRDSRFVGPNALVSCDRIGGRSTRIFTKVVANPEAMTVDYHCAWDQGDKLWMIYLMRVVPAELVFDAPGSVVLWTNCRHPFYDANPHPEKAPEGRSLWVGDIWPLFYAGHLIELQNLKTILEYRNKRGLPINPRGASEMPR